MDPGGIKKEKYFLLLLGLLVAGGFLVFSYQAQAAPGINKKINFQGKVVNSNGTNITNGSYNFLFCIYTTDSPATPCTAGANNDAVWRESKSLTVTDGIFQTDLGDTTTLPGSVDFNTDNIYLGVNFNSNGQMTPLIQFTSSPYAFNSANLEGKTWAAPGTIGSSTPNTAAFTTLSSNSTTNLATGAASTFGIGNSTGAGTIASGGTSSWTNTSGNLTISTATSGTLALTSAAGLNLTAAGTGTGIGATTAVTTGTGLALTTGSLTTGIAESITSTIASAAGEIANGLSLIFTDSTSNTGGFSAIKVTDSAGTGTGTGNKRLLDLQVGNTASTFASAGDLIFGSVNRAAGVGTFNLLNLQSGSSLESVLKVDAFGDLLASNSTDDYSALDGTTTANGAGNNSTSLVLTSAASFDIGNYVQVNSNNCGGTGINPCYAKITNKATNTLTITPALSWQNNSTVNEVHIPEIGNTNVSGVLENRYGRGYFIGGTVTGNASTYYLDQEITTADEDGGDSLPFTIRTGNTTTSGNSGNISIDTGSAAGTEGTITLGGTNASGLTLGRAGLAVSVPGTISDLTSINKVAITAPATGATLTLSDGSSLITSGGDSLTFTTTADTNVTLPVSGTLMVNPMIEIGDIIYGGASGAPQRLDGSAVDNYVLKYDLDTNTPFWDTAGGGHTQNTDTGTDGVSFNIGNNDDAAAVDITLKFGDTNPETFYFDGNGTDNFKLSDDLDITGRLTASGSIPADGSGANILVDLSADYSNLATAGDSYTGLKVNVTDTADPDVTQKYLLDLQVGGVSSLYIDSVGRIVPKGDSVYIGAGTGASNTTGNGNFFLGDQAGTANTSGNNDVFIGQGSGISNTEGRANMFLGSNSGYANTVGSSNVFIGDVAGRYNTDGFNNIAIGGQTLYNADPLAGKIESITDATPDALFTSTAHGLSGGETIIIRGTDNYDGKYTAVINNADSFYISADGGLSNVDYVGDGKAEDAYWSSGPNTAIGSRAGFNTTAGYANVFYGFESGFSNVSGAGNIFLGYHAGYNETGSNKLYIENSDSTSPLIYGEFDNNLVNINGTLGLLEAGGTPTYHTIFQSGDLTGADSTYTWPDAYPAVSGYVLSSTDAGVMSWVEMTGGHTQNTDTGTTGTSFNIGSTTDQTTNDITLSFGNNTPETLYFDGNGTDNFKLSNDLDITGGLTTTGAVGVGIDSPARKVHIKSGTPDDHLAITGSAPSVNLWDADTFGASSYVAVFGLATGSGHYITGSAAGDFIIRADTGDILFGTGSTEQMRVDTATGDLSLQGNIKVIENGGSPSLYGIFDVDNLTTADKTYTFPDLSGTVALTANKLSAFAATTSAELSGVLSDENTSGGYMTDPMTTIGDIIIADTNGVPKRLAGSGTNGWVLTYNTGTNAPEWAVPVGGSQTPWTSDIDADGWDLNDLSNILFRETTGAPIGTDVGFYRDNTGDLTGNVLTGKTFNIAVNAGDEYNFSSTGLAFNSNNITGLGTNLTAAGALTIASAGTDALTLDPVGAGSLVFGSADVTAMTFTTDNNAANDFTFDGGTTFNDDATWTLAGTENVAIGNTTMGATTDLLAIASTWTADNAGSGLKITTTYNVNASTNEQSGLEVISASNGANTGAIDAMAIFSNEQGTDTAPDGLIVRHNVGSGTMTDGIDVENVLAGGTITNAFIVEETAGTIVNGFVVGAGVGTAIVMQQGESIDNTTNNQINMNLGTSGTLLLTSGTVATIANSAGNLTLDSFSNALTIAASDTTLTASGIATVDLAGTVAIDSTIYNLGGGSATTIQTASGNAGLTIASNGSGALTLDPTGAGSLALGSADVTAMTFTTDNNAANDFTFDGGTTFNDDATWTLAGTENLTIGNTTMGAANLVNINPTWAADNAADGLRITTTYNTNNTTAIQTGLFIRNADNGASTGAIDALAIFSNDQATETFPDGLIVRHNAASGTMTDGIDVENTTAGGTITNAISIEETAGTITNGLKVGSGVGTAIVMQQGESIDNTTDNQINLNLGTSGTLLLTSGTAATLSNSAGNLTLDANSQLTLADAQINLTGGTAVTFETNNASNVTVGFLNSGAGAANLRVDGLVSCDTIDTDASGNLVCGTDSGASVSPFASAGGVITKATAGDYLSLRYGDAADTQLIIENTTSTTIPTADAMQIDLTGNTTGIVTNGVDGLQISMEVGNGTANTNTGLNISMAGVNTPSGDEVIRGINLSNTTATSATETAITIGSNWDNAISISSGNLLTSNLGVEFTESDTNPSCAAGDYKIYADSSETRLKKCVNGVATDLTTPDMPSFVDTTFSATTWTDADTVSLFTDSPIPNITPKNTTDDILIMVAIRGTVNPGSTTADTNPMARVDYEAGVTSDCADTNNIGGTFGLSINDISATVPFETNYTFVHSPSTTNKVEYAICNSADSAGMAAAATVTRTEVTLFEINATTGDLAEIYPTNDESIQPGELVSMDPAMSIGIQRSQAFDANVMGVVTTRPALVIGSKEGEGTTGKPVALAGRVPVKVSTENGPIKKGDVLTVSSVPGSAMKATKAGQMVGISLGDFSGEGVGSVMAFVKMGYFTGSNLKNILQGTDSSQVKSFLSENELNKATLQYFLEQKPIVEKSEAISEILTDRVAAGLEIVTPKVTADEVVLNKIEAATGLDINVNLADGGVLKIGNLLGENGIVFDSAGNATFQGTLTAESIVANKILGLEIFTNQISGIDENVADLSAKLDGLKAATEAPLDLSALGILEKKGALVIAKATTFQEATFFEKLVTLAGNVIFRGEVSFEKVPTFNSDTAGYALIKEGADRVRIEFGEEYANAPVVNATLSLQNYESAEVREAAEELLLVSDAKYIVTNVSTKGFEIKLGQKALSDIPFAWTALAVKGAKTFESVAVSEDKSKDENNPEIIPENTTVELAPVVEEIVSAEVAPETPGEVPSEVIPAETEIVPDSEPINSAQTATPENTLSLSEGLVFP